MLLKLLMILNLVVVNPLLAQVFVENGTITMKFTQQPLLTVLNEVTSKTGINFIYNASYIKNKFITCNFRDSSFEAGVKNLLHNAALDYKKFGERNYVLIKKDSPRKYTFEAVVEEKSTVRNEEIIKINRPILIYQGNPSYPPEAQQKNITGKVEVKLLISEKGKVIKTLIDKSSGFSLLDEAASNYCGNLFFKPASVNQKPIKIWMSLVVNYKIDDFNK